MTMILEEVPVVERTIVVSSPFAKPSPLKAEVILVAGALASFPTTNAVAATIRLDSSRLTDRWTSGGHSSFAHRDGRTFSSEVAELRARSALTWEQLSRLLNVERRSVHLWASGRPVSAGHAEHLGRVLGVIRRMDRGQPSATRAWLLQPNSDGELPLDLLRAERFDEILLTEAPAQARRPAPLAAAAARARRPLPPEASVDARQERVHREKGTLLSAVPLKNPQRK